MDKSLSMSEVMLGELLLEHAGLTSTERLMVMTSTNNDLDFGKVAEALVKQHALSKGSTRDYRSGKGKGGTAKGHWRSNASRGYLAYEDDGDYEYPDEEYGHAGEAYLGYDTSGYDGWEAWEGYDASTTWFHDETWEEWNPEEEMSSHVVYEEMIDSCTRKSWQIREWQLRTCKQHTCPVITFEKRSTKINIPQKPIGLPKASSYQRQVQRKRKR